MPKTPAKRNRGAKAKPSGGAPPKSPVRNSKTSGKNTPTTTPEPSPTASTHSSSPPPKSLSTRALRDFFASAPITTGVLKRPSYREREFEWSVAIGVEDVRRDTLKVLMDYPGGQHVVALFFPIKDISEWPAWKSFNTGEMLQAHHQSDFERTFEVSTSFLSDLLEMTPRNLQLLEKKKHAVKFGRGRWDLVGTVKAYMAAIRDEFQGRGGKEYSEERTKDKREQRLMRELDRRQKAEQLVDAEEYKAAAYEMGLKYRKALENLIPRVSPLLVHAKSQPKVRAILKPEIEQILTSLALNQDIKHKRKKRAGSSTKRK